MNKSFKSFVALAALALLLPGSLALAKENGKDHRSDRGRTERREDRVTKDDRGSREVTATEAVETTSVDTVDSGETAE